MPWDCHANRVDIEFYSFWTAETSLVKVVIYVFTGNCVEAYNLLLILTIPICCSVCIRSLHLNRRMFSHWILDHKVLIKILLHLQSTRMVPIDTRISFLFDIRLFQGPSNSRYLFRVSRCFRLRRQISFIFNVVCLLLN